MSELAASSAAVTGGREAPARPYSMSTCSASRGSIPLDASRPEPRRRALLMPDPISGTAEPKLPLPLPTSHANPCALETPSSFPIALRGRGLAAREGKADGPWSVHGWRRRNRFFWASYQCQSATIHGLKPHGPWPINEEEGNQRRPSTSPWFFFLRKSLLFLPQLLQKSFFFLNFKTGKIISINFLNYLFYFYGAVSKAVLLQQMVVLVVLSFAF